MVVFPSFFSFRQIQENIILIYVTFNVNIVFCDIVVLDFGFTYMRECIYCVKTVRNNSTCEFGCFRLIVFIFDCGHVSLLENSETDKRLTKKCSGRQIASKLNISKGSVVNIFKELNLKV